MACRMMFNSVEGASTLTVVILNSGSARDDIRNGRNISGEVSRRVGACT
jgi:hypothetical protein